MTARELEHTEKTLNRQRRAFRERVLLAGVATAAAASCAPLVPRLAIAFGVAAAAGAALAAVTRYGHRERISQLALDARAYAIPEVAAYGRRCAASRERERLAEWLRDAVVESQRGDSLFLCERVARHAGDLERTAAELASAARVRPPAAVACRRLLTHAVESPLYNPRLPAEELTAALARIRRGIAAG